MEQSSAAHRRIGVIARQVVAAVPSGLVVAPRVAAALRDGRPGTTTSRDF